MKMPIHLDRAMDHADYLSLVGILNGLTFDVLKENLEIGIEHNYDRLVNSIPDLDVHDEVGFFLGQDVYVPQDNRPYSEFEVQVILQLCRMESTQAH